VFADRGRITGKQEGDHVHGGVHPVSEPPRIRELSRFASNLEFRAKMPNDGLFTRALKPDERGLGDAPAKSQGKLALALGVIESCSAWFLGFVYLISVRRLEREVARSPSRRTV